MATLAKIKLKNGDSWQSLLDITYPVGSYYVANTATSPATRFGGSWTTITGRFLYANAGTATGGSNDAIIPYHNHTGSTTNTTHSHGMNYALYLRDNNGASRTVNGSYYYTERFNATVLATTNSGSHNHPVTINYAGTSGNTTNANMPAYQTVYCWYRTA